MSYTVLARKFRSQTYGEVVGQDPITATLRNAIVSDRIHHGYLFCGTRGVGKTSMARILAKCLNCLSSDKPTPDPCCTCDSCESIARGEDVDVIEIDAASNTGVDSIRDLRSNAIYRPARARFKVYIIDEVHMLSTAAFSALLKTLEEPPDHVKFIFATTEPQKVPATIQSRVQRFDFKSISVPEIATQLESICKKEEVSADAAAIRRIARLANGSMRDALSLLDQVLSLSETISPEVVDEILPVPHDEVLSRLIDRVAEGDAAGALAVVDESLGQGYTLDYWCTLLIGQMRDLMVLRVCGAETELVDAPAGLRPVLLEQSGKFDAGAYVYMISLLEELRRSVKFSGSGRALVDSAVVRLAEASNFSSIETLLECVEGV
ncbi:MAG: DNA polymerase III subunit gamma/tau, partial [Planctomycetota bacterium]|nr:DNA polymerase III subunit gamma/tau [Planctomycetota bacterium]